MTEEIILESRLNNHSFEELESFGPFILDKIKEFRKGKDRFIQKMLNELFDDFQGYYPEMYFIGIYIKKINDNRRYVFKREFKNHKYWRWFITPDEAIRYAKKISKMHGIKLYKDERKNNRITQYTSSKHNTKKVQKG